MSDEATIGARVRMLRKRADLDQAEMAEKLGISLRAYQKMERDENVPSGETLLNFIKMEVNPGWILTGIGPEGLNPPAASKATPEIDIVLLQRLGDTVQAVFIECKQTPPPRAVTAEAGKLYNELVERVRDLRDREIVEAAIMVLRDRFKERIQQAEPGSGKRSAS